MGIRFVLVSDDSVEVVADEIAEFVGHFAETLSPEGVFLETQPCPKKGCELSLTLRLADGFVLVSALAMVAWRRAPRIDSGTTGGFALHFLRVDEGAEFLQRFVRENEAKGGSGFSIEREAPLTPDGKPLEESALDQMMSQRGAGGVATDLMEVGSLPKKEEPIDAPDFAPGFGRSESWGQEVVMPIPGEVDTWLNTSQEEVVSPARPAEPAPAPISPISAESPAVPVRTGRSGPIRMKMKSDRQPGSEKPARGKSSESFVEVSRRASELFADEASRSTALPVSPNDELGQIGISEPDDSALATIAVGPGEMAKFLEAARIAEESANEEVEAVATGAATNLPSVGSGQGSLKEESQEEESVAASDYQPELRIDSDVLGQEMATQGQFGYPEEERGPMMLIGIIVGVILLALVLWSVL